LNDLGGGLSIGPDPNAPQYTIQNYYSAVDNITWTKGKHSLKFGVEYAEYISPQNFTQRARGDYEYNATQLFLEDYSPDYLGQRSTGSTTYYGNQKAIYWYADDTWSVTTNLTLNLGVRYEYTSIPLGEQRQGLNTVANSPGVIIPQTGQPLLFTTPYAPKKDYAPRVGFAYSPGTSGTTSIRGGFGMAYDTLYDNIGILAVPPQIGSTNNVNTNAAPTPNFVGSGALAGGGSGLTVLDRQTAMANTASWIPPNVKYPYSVNWSLGVQHSFAKNYTAEVNYVGTRGNHLDVQNILNFQSVLTAQNYLPTYLQAPDQATLNGLTSSNLNALENLNIIPDNLNNVDQPGVNGCPGPPNTT
ncbi:MAG: TonB-dependent receptor domain-containing protein, partial [Candidatus Dormibacteraceae bacterium]